jgi:hypothetical protein
MLGSISLDYVWVQPSEKIRRYIYVLVYKLRVFNLLCYFSSSRFLVFFISIIDSVDVPPNTL